MKKILFTIILSILFCTTLVASNYKTKSSIFYNKNYKLIPTDGIAPAECIIYGIIEFLDGSFFCLNKKGKLTNKSFFEGEFEGTYYYLNGNVFTGKFFKGKKLEGGMDRSNGTEIVDCEGLKMFTCDTKKVRRYQKYFKDGDLFYDVNYWLHEFGKCELRPYFLLTSSYKKGWNKKSHGIYVLERGGDEGRRPNDRSEDSWCYSHYTSLGPFFFKYTYLYALIILAPLSLFLFYLIIISRRNNLIHNHNLKHKTKFKKYSEYKERIDKIKSKELKKDEQNRAKLEKTSDLDDDSLMSKVKRLKSLYNNGTLTKAEFEKAKNKLLK